MINSKKKKKERGGIQRAENQKIERFFGWMMVINARPSMRSDFTDRQNAGEHYTSHLPRMLEEECCYRLCMLPPTQLNLMFY